MAKKETANGKAKKSAPKQSAKDEQQTKGTQEVTIQRIFLKDFSFETPSTPGIFTDEWTPEMKLDLQTNTTSLEDDLHEVVLTVSVTVKSKETVAFIAEVKQAGVFLIKGFPAQMAHQLLGSFCPSTLFPYAREVITNAVSKGSFPHLYLAPINFDALYAKHMEQQEKDKS